MCLSELLSLIQNNNECSIKGSSSKTSTTVGIETPISVPVQTNDMEHSTNRPEFKFRTRQPSTDPNSENVKGQGIASRRIRLQIESSSGSTESEVSSFKSQPLYPN